MKCKLMLADGGRHCEMCTVVTKTCLLMLFNGQSSTMVKSTARVGEKLNLDQSARQSSQCQLTVFWGNNCLCSWVWDECLTFKLIKFIWICYPMDASKLM